MSGDVIDLEAHRKTLREATKKREDDDSLVKCPDCEDVLFWMIRITGSSPDEPLAVICQHCNEPVGYAFEFPPDDETE